MKKIRSALLMVGMMFVLALAAVSCAQTGAETMSGSSMETDMENMSGDKMDKDMDKTMDTMGEEKMDRSMGHDMQKDMK